MLCTITEAARILGLSQETVRKSLNTGQIRYVTVGRRRLIPKQWLLRFAGGEHDDDYADENGEIHVGCFDGEES